MTGAFEWLNQMMTWLGRWVPRLMLIQPTHRGVKFGPRGHASQVGPGLIMFWPMTHVIVEIPITTQSIQLCSQILPAEPAIGQPDWLLPRVVICGAAIQFRVFDAVRAATATLSLHALVDNRASAAITRHHACDRDRAQWQSAVCADLETELQSYGVEIERFDFTQIGAGVALKNVGDWSYADGETGKRAS